MLRFELRQLRLESLGRYYLPLPKLTSQQMRALGDRLDAEGFSVRAAESSLTATSSAGRITIARSGIAWSSGDMLDAIAPAVPGLLSSSTETIHGNPYFAVKKLRRGFEVQLFPRMEGLRLWTALRGAGECGLTPDEKVAVSRILEGVDRELECVTDYPTYGSSVLQIAKKQYYRSSVPAPEFVSRLRTVTDFSTRNSFLPRSSVIRVTAGSPSSSPNWEELGEWCYVRFPPKSL